jgi:hypothetical protein
MGGDAKSNLTSATAISYRTIDDIYRYAGTRGSVVLKNGSPSLDAYQLVYETSAFLHIPRPKILATAGAKRAVGPWQL